MQPTHIGIWGAVELVKAERQVALTNALVELQRQLIEYLEQTGNDSDCAKVNFDSLLEWLALSVKHRHRLRRDISEKVNAA
jgi:hypothetical protein